MPYMEMINKNSKIIIFMFGGILKQKMSGDTLLIKYIFFAILSKLINSEPYLAILLFYDANLMATVATFFSFLFYNFFPPSPYLSHNL